MKVLSCEMDVCGFARRAASVSMMEFSFVVVENGAGPEQMCIRDSTGCEPLELVTSVHNPGR